MGLMDWFKKQDEPAAAESDVDPEVPEDLVRAIYLLGTTPEVVVSQINAYERLRTRGVVSHMIRVSEPVGGWIRVEVPHTLHVFHFHNLAQWFTGVPGQEGVAKVVLLTSSTATGFPKWSYGLMPDPKSKMGDTLIGKDWNGNQLRIFLPKHEVMRIPGGTSKSTEDEFLAPAKLDPSLRVPLEQGRVRIAAEVAIRPKELGGWGNPAMD